MKNPVELNGKTVLVTGCPGFIGANLVLRLLKEMSGGTVQPEKIGEMFVPV